MKLVQFSLRDGNKYHGNIGGDSFFIGSRVPYAGGKGLQNITGSKTEKYDRNLFRAQHGFWADFIHPTAMAEGGLYHTLNTYDRACFTFTFLQYAAHVPNGDFVVFLRALLALPLAEDYFPDSRLRNQRICRVGEDSRMTALESDESTAGLQDYLNPSRREIEDTGVIQAAKFVHWAQHDALHRNTQIDIGVSLLKRQMQQYALRYRLDGTSDVECLLVCDIRHQGRAQSATIVAALRTPKPVDELLKIGAQQYPNRVRTLRNEIKTLVDNGTLGKRKYSVPHQDFVPM